MNYGHAYRNVLKLMELARNLTLSVVPVCNRNEN